MGALTLKSFPFELRGWDIEKFESIDPTDGFGSTTRVYISKNQVIQIEPDYNSQTSNTWLTDKGRQYFDGIFGAWNPKKNTNSTKLSKKSWKNIVNNLIKTLYIYDHCNAIKNQNYYFTIVFENISLEILSIILIFSKKYAFIKLRRVENIKTKQNDLEANFQLNLNSKKLKTSNFCLFIGTNTRYEGYLLNLQLRKRFLKGNFKCIVIGSFIDLTFPISFQGSNLNILKTIVEGNNLICQDLKTQNNPVIILNNEILKRSDGSNLLKMLKILKHTNIITNTWNGLQILNPSLNECGIQALNSFLPLTNHDLINFSSLYFLNVSLNNKKNIQKITEAKLLNMFLNQNNLLNNKVIIDQNYSQNQNYNLYKRLFLNNKTEISTYIHLPTSIFYENEESFINTMGFIKRTSKLISKKKTKNSWQIFRRFLKKFNNQITFSNKKDNNIIFFNSKKISNFKNFIHFQFYATKNLNIFSFYLNNSNKPFIIYNINNKFKNSTLKIYSTKIKYWLDDFFIGGKDEYSHNSLIMNNCSRIIRSDSTNFF